MKLSLRSDSDGIGPNKYSTVFEGLVKSLEAPEKRYR